MAVAELENRRCVYQNGGATDGHGCTQMHAANPVSSCVHPWLTLVSVKWDAGASAEIGNSKTLLPNSCGSDRSVHSQVAQAWD